MSRDSTGLGFGMGVTLPLNGDGVQDYINGSPFILLSSFELFLVKCSQVPSRVNFELYKINNNTSLIIYSTCKDSKILI